MALVTLELAEHVSGASIVFTIDDVALEVVSADVRAGSRQVTVTVYRNNKTVLYSRTFQPEEVVSIPMTVLNRKITTRIVQMSLGVTETKYDWPHLVEFH